MTTYETMETGKTTEREPLLDETSKSSKRFKTGAAALVLAALALAAIGVHKTMRVGVTALDNNECYLCCKYNEYGVVQKDQLPAGTAASSYDACIASFGDGDDEHCYCQEQHGDSGHKFAWTVANASQPDVGCEDSNAYYPKYVICEEFNCISPDDVPKC